MSAWTVIAHTEVGSGGAANITFSSIPATYTDLVIKCSLRSTRTATSVDNVLLNINSQGNSTNITNRYLGGDGSSAFSATGGVDGGVSATNASTASTFGNNLIYIANYAGSTNKSISVDSVNENNATYALQVIAATLWSQTAAISSVSLVPANGSWTQYSSATLFGVTKGSSGGVTVS